MPVSTTIRVKSLSKEIGNVHPFHLHGSSQNIKKDIVIRVECIFSWYWLDDYCASIGISFKLGHAFYMRAIYGCKSKNDKIDAQKITFLLKGGNFPLLLPIRRR